MSRKISSDDRAAKRRVPAACRGIQVNFCKSPVCVNFGVPPKDGIRAPGRSADPDPNYSISGLGAGETGFRCKSCNEILPAKSNRGVYLEFRRISDYLTTVDPACPNEQCINHRLGLKSHSACYYRHGTNRHGTPRYRCRACGRTFSVGKSTRKQRMPHKNIELFKLLINKMPLRRILEFTGLSFSALYGKIDFLHRQCLHFIGHRERRLLDGFEKDRLYLSTDRQVYILNWTRRTDRRNVQFDAVGTADNDSGYVFALNLNFNDSLNAERIEDWVLRCGDYARPKPLRRHAHLWLNADYTDSVAETLRNQAKRKQKQGGGTLSDAIAHQYGVVDLRSDVEAAEAMDSDLKLPHKGMQIHNEYTLYAHFLLLARMFCNVGKVRFYMDFESGIRAAFMAAFQGRVLEHSADAWYVKINKDMTVPERERAKQLADTAFEEYKEEHPELESDYAVKIAMIKEEIDRMRSIGKWKDRWLRHPFPSMSEPEKQLCWLTDLDDYDLDHQAALYNKGSLHAIDRAFMQARRRLSYIERPIQTASTHHRTWYGYTAYDPARIGQALDIFRTAYNYCLTGQDDKTPAMRLGLAKGKVAIEDIVYYT